MEIIGIIKMRLEWEEKEKSWREREQQVIDGVNA